MSTKARAAGRPAARRRKNFRLDQGKLDTARKLLGDATDTETIERALEHE
jgi:hypothetical protein